MWRVAPDLFDRANALQNLLEREASVEFAADDVRALARLLPTLPDDYAEADPYPSGALQSGTIGALLALDSGDRGALRIAIERIRQALRDMLDERPVWQGDAKDAAVWLGRTGVSAEDLAKVFSVSPDTVRRWTNPNNPKGPGEDVSDRVVVVAKIVNHLRHAMSSRGVVQWLLRAHPALDDRRPVDDLKDATAYHDLVRLASSARSFVAT